MDEVVYNSLVTYFNVLSALGYKKYKDIKKILALILIKDFIYSDFYGYITEEDYRQIERALYCIFGSSCLVPYPDFCDKPMNKLSLGSVTEMANIIKKYQIEHDKIVDAFDTRITNIENTKVAKPVTEEINIPDIELP